MMSELFTLSLVMIMIVQSSSLWTSLLTIPISILLIKSMSSDISSGLYIFIFIMVFIGGLLVLLVGVASAVSQEQAMSYGLIVLIGVIALLFPFFFFWSFYIEVFSLMTFFCWLMKMKWVFMMLNILMICTGLFVMSSLLMEYKSIVRKL